MSTFGNVLAPGQTNALFDLADTQGAMARNRLLDQRLVTGQQDLADRAAWREAAPGLASGDPEATGLAFGANPTAAVGLMGARQAQQLRGYQIDDQEHQLAVRVAGEVMGFPAEQRPAEYARIIGAQQGQGRLQNAPAAYPGDAHFNAIVQSGLSGHQLYLQRQDGADRDNLRGRFGFSAAGGNAGATPPGAPPSSAPSAAGAITPAGQSLAPEAFAQQYGPLAERAGAALGVSPRIIMGQLALETGWGRSFAGRNNPFNMTAVRSASATEGQDRDRNGPITQRFQNFETPEEAADHYVGRVRRLWPGVVGAGDDLSRFTGGLRLGQQGGYSTDPDGGYHRSVESIVRRLPGDQRRADAGGAAARYPGAADVAGGEAGDLPADLVAIATGGDPGVIAVQPGAARSINPAVTAETEGAANPGLRLDPASIRARTMDPDGLLRDPIPRTGAQLREGGYAADGTDELTADYAARQSGPPARVNALLARRGTLARPQDPMIAQVDAVSPMVRPPMTDEEDRTRGMSPDVMARRNGASAPAPAPASAAPAASPPPVEAASPAAGAVQVPEVSVTARRPVTPPRQGVPSLGPPPVRRNSLMSDADRLNGISLDLARGNLLADSPEARTIDIVMGTGRFSAPAVAMASAAPVMREELAPLGPQSNRLMLAGPPPAAAAAAAPGQRRNALMGPDSDLPLPPPPAPEPPPLQGGRDNALLPPAPPAQAAGGGDDLPLPPPPAPGDPRDAVPAGDATAPRGAPGPAIARPDVISGRGDWRDGLTQGQVTQIDAMTQGRGVREADVHGAIRQFRTENTAAARDVRDDEYRRSEATGRREFQQQQAEENRTFRADQARAAAEAKLEAARARPGRPIPAGDRTSLVQDGGRLSELGTLRSGFSNDFAGYVSSTVGDAANMIARNTPGDSPRAEWWSRYQSLKNQVRHSMFGAALTPGEAREFDKADINTGMSHEAVRTALGRQEEIVRGALTRRARSLAADGYGRDAIEESLGVRLDALAPNDAAGAERQQRGGPQQGASGAGGSAPVRVSTPEEAMKLAPGTQFTTPDGRTMRVPAR